MFPVEDFYPEQTIQPFLVADSLLRLGLAREEALDVVTFDVSPRVNAHLREVRAAGVRGEPYLVHLPLPIGEDWTRELRAYWRQAGAAIGTVAKALPAPSTDPADVRAISVRAGLASRVNVVDMDIVTQRFVPVAGEAFDLAIATNVFVYYAPGEQALAAANVAAIRSWLGMGPDDATATSRSRLTRGSTYALTACPPITQ